MKVIAITGGIASGKSNVSNVIKKLGYTVLNADIISKDVSDNNQKAKQQIIEAFGEQYYNADGSYNRRLMAELVFNNKTALQKLNSILHPLINDEIKNAINYYEQIGTKFLFIEIPLLFEANMQGLANIIITCYTSKNQQIKRLKTRNNLNEEQALARINSQISTSEKLKLSHYSINTSYTFKNTESQVLQIINKIVGE